MAMVLQHAGATAGIASGHGIDYQLLQALPARMAKLRLRTCAFCAEGARSTGSGTCSAGRLPDGGMALLDDTLTLAHQQVMIIW